MGFRSVTLIIAICAFAIAAPLMVLYHLKSCRQGTVKFSSLRTVSRVPRTLKYRLRHVPMILRLLVLAFLLLGFARPRIPKKTSIISTEGVAIQMVVDRSSSMRELMRFDGREMSRFEVVERVFGDFILGNKNRDLGGRKSDLAGLSSFALYAEENCPLTLNHENLVAFMDTIEPVRKPFRDRYGAPHAPPDDGTAIGDAIYHAVLVLINAEEAVEESQKPSFLYKITSKVLILLTDGQQNAGEMDPVDAAKVAKENDIKIYSIAMVSEERAMTRDTPFGRFYVPGETLDTSQIEQAAEITGGKFFEATDGESLAKIYREIDELEKSTFKERVSDYDDRFQDWWAVPMGLILLVSEIVLRNTFFRTVP